MLLQYHDDCSDAQAEQKMCFDLRWKHELGLGLEDEGFDATVMCLFCMLHLALRAGLKTCDEELFR